MHTTVELKYGSRRLPIAVPRSAGFLGILTPQQQPPLKDAAASVAESLIRPIESRPLQEIATGRIDACIVISDITRPVPNQLLLPPILTALQRAGIDEGDITILIATGIHRPNEGEELVRLVGPEIAARYRVENHFSKRQEDLETVGTIMGSVPVSVNRRYLQSDLKILTGFIEPHMWAGYSGGRKSILPGISSVQTLEYMHGPQMIAHPDVVYGKLEGNPFHEAGLQIMDIVGADFIVNVTLDTEKRVTGAYSGHPVEAHLAGCRELTPYSTVFVDEPLDFVVTTNGGAPLDVNLYQTSKGIAGVAPVVKPGGDIVVASECGEGLGSEEFVRALNEFTDPDDWLARALRREFSYPDQWCAQEIFKWMSDRTIHLYCDGISEESRRRYGIVPCVSVGDTVTELLAKHGTDARWAAVPDGPYLILRTA